MTNSVKMIFHARYIVFVIYRTITISDEGEDEIKRHEMKSTCNIRIINKGRNDLEYIIVLILFLTENLYLHSNRSSHPRKLSSSLATR